ncbi:helix-turn-helix domain-containing protein [Intestinimonas butyriciproducens]|uniref:helix-turn-helix domain-containing protein n=1 Tax=Intestinimonas butyriciproducens TaxID=1297617 RepID=UPI002431CB8D|nr:helix-turn-helix transcriptional regulator [Intestinimonas butyriciproducens]MCI6362869.1 helix-turn-helix domain-containing protein [Intestinimonas butyriciproducens]
MAGFGELLAELRKDKSMTQHELADVLHVSAGTISNYETGVHFPDIEKLVNLADFFNVTTDYLLGRCGSNLSPDVFKNMVTEEKTVGDIITALQQLPEERKRILTQIIDDMEFRMAINRYNKKERQ